MGVSIVNTMLKFRYNSAVARLNSYKQYWNRINTMIESGKYSRERFKMEIHQQREKLQPQPSQNSSEVEQLYRQYIDARRSCKMTAESITPEMVASLIEKQKPAIMKKYKRWSSRWSSRVDSQRSRSAPRIELQITPTARFINYSHPLPPNIVTSLLHPYHVLIRQHMAVYCIRFLYCFFSHPCINIPWVFAPLANIATSATGDSTIRCGQRSFTFTS
jgi:hypothetical protein